MLRKQAVAIAFVLLPAALLPAAPGTGQKTPAVTSQDFGDKIKAAKTVEEVQSYIDVTASELESASSGDFSRFNLPGDITEDGKKGIVSRLKIFLAADKKYLAFLKAGGKPEEFQWQTVEEVKTKIAAANKLLRVYRTAAIRENLPNDIQESIVTWDKSFRKEYEFQSAIAKRKYIRQVEAAIVDHEKLIRKILATPDDSKITAETIGPPK